jgi:hypothetical protein
MTTIAMSRAAQAEPGDTNATRAGMLRRLFDAVVAARMRQAERVASARFALMSDAQLTGLGLSAAEIASVRADTRIGDVPSERR